MKCAEQIKAAALVCRYCGHEFAEPVVTGVKGFEKKEAAATLNPLHARRGSAGGLPPAAPANLKFGKKIGAEINVTQTFQANGPSILRKIGLRKISIGAPAARD